MTPRSSTPHRLGALAEQVSDRMLTVMRVYFEKPRTTVGWKGAIYDPHLDGSFDITTGLRRARSFLSEVARMGVFAATEFLDPIVPQYTADLVSWAAIGARTAESQTHRQMASGLSMPVGFKNGTGGSVQLAVDAVVAAQATHGFLGIDMNGRASAVQTKGKPSHAHCAARRQHGHELRRCLRGGRAAKARVGRPSTPTPGGLQPRELREGLHQDAGCLHRCCGAARGRKRGVVGCMLESNINPGNQKLNGGAEGLEYGVSITDPCIGWDETEELFDWAHDRLGKLRIALKWTRERLARARRRDPALV